jgi:tetratricopeptide (TPR) repeat protein
MNRKQRRAEAQLGRPDSRAPIAHWFKAALAHLRAERAADAERVCRRILSIDPSHAPTLHLLGLIEHQSGRSRDAVEHIRMAITRDSADPAFHHNLGNILRAQNRLAEAKECYERALALAPGSADTLYNLGNTCQDLGQPKPAIAYFEKALRLNPKAIELHNNLGMALQDLGRLDEAIGCYRKALSLQPGVVESLDNLAGALRERGELDAAQTYYERALGLRPDHVESHIGLGVVLRDRGRLEEAVAHYRRALSLSPDDAEANNNLAIALADLGQLEEALAHHKRALLLRPDRAENHYNFGGTLQRQGRYADALACYGRALALNPDYAQAHFNRSLALLVTGEFDDGWHEYEWRFAVNVHGREFGQPQWSGEPLAGATILVHAEQGFGDTLQFLRYIPAVVERGGRVVLEVPSQLVRLAGTVAGASRVVGAGNPLPAFARHCPLLSLPRVLRTTLATIPSAVPYLSVPTEVLAAWSERIAATGLRVGLVWAGRTVGAIDLRLLQPLWEVAGISWFSLQVGDEASDLSSLDGVKIADLSPWLTDFAETAAAVHHLDLVISVDTSVAHLAGALARPTWIMLRHPPEWRWLLERKDSPWYPTARLFRQTKEGDWQEVVHEIAAALAQIAPPNRPWRDTLQPG